MLFNRLKYPPRLVDSTISTFIAQQYKAANQEPESSKQKVVRIALPFKEQLANLSNVNGNFYEYKLLLMDDTQRTRLEGKKSRV